MFGFVLKLVAERGLVKGERIGVDGSTMEANAALRTIVRRDNGESYRHTNPRKCGLVCARGWRGGRARNQSLIPARHLSDRVN